MNSVFLRTATNRVSRAHAVVQVSPMAEKQWPLWAEAISFFKSDTDIGVGDTVERIIGKANSAGFKAWHLKTFGKGCGCSERKSLWNAKFPYDKR